MKAFSNLLSLYVGTLFCGTLVLTIFPAVAHAAPKGKDYGAETIEANSQAEKVAANALPVELVEEQGAPVATSANAKQGTPTVPNQATTDSGLPDDISPDALLDSDTTTLLNAKDVDIATLVKTFSKLTKRNYVVDSSVKGTITIHLPTAVTLAEALRIFDSVLLLKGFTTVPIGKNVWKVISAKDAQQTTIPLESDTPAEPTDRIVTHLVRLKYVQASDMQQLLSKFASKDGAITSFSATNSLIVIDSQANIERLRKLISELDVPARDQDITIIPINHATAKDISEKVNEILGEKDKDETSPATNILTRRQLALQSRTTSRNKQTTESGNVESSRTLPLKIIPDERTNSLIVVADEEMTTKVRILVEQLDSEVDLSGGRFFVYRLKHADAEEIAEILGQLISGAAASESKSTTGTSGGSSLTRTRNTQTTPATSFSERIADALRRRRSASRGSDSDQSDGDRVNLEGEVSIAADPSTNSLIINASRGDYLRIKNLLDELDVKRRQVLVEATILEVSLNKQEGLGVELQGTAATDEAGVIAQTNYGGLTNLITNPAALSDLTIAAASAGTITLPGGIVLPSQAAIITAVSTNSNVNVLSTPTILTTDNQEAQIIVGENVPFVSSTSTDPTNLNNTFNQVEREDVGIKMRITPQISTGDFVTLKIFVEISNVVAGTRNDPNGPTTTIRTTETTVEVRDGQMIVTGGLISDNVTESTRGVPFFQDIPVLGNLFKREDVDRRRTNLLVFLTPKIFADQHDARAETIDRRDKLENVIFEQGTEPDRAEILHQRNIDRVTEHSNDDDSHFSTITPPQTVSGTTPTEGIPDAEAALSRTKNRIDSLLAGSTPASNNKQAPASTENAFTNGGDEPAPAKTAPQATTNRTSGDAINIKVKPQLPTAVPSASARGSLSSTTQASISPDARTFVVLRELKSMDKSAGTKTGPNPFDSQGSVAVVVPGTIDSPTGRFFEVGGRYTFNKAGKARRFVCLGKFGSQQEATTIYPALANKGSWHNMSPKESLTLGQQPWQKG